jgi:hypothetical protein
MIDIKKSKHYGPLSESSFLILLKDDFITFFVNKFT